VVAIGFIPDRQAHTARLPQLAPVAQAALEDHVVVRELTHRIAKVSERARTRMTRLGEPGAASRVILIEVVRALGKQRWMLRAQLGTHTDTNLPAPTTTEGP